MLNSFCGYIRSMNKRIRTIAADNIRHLRNKLNLSQEALGDRAGLHRTYIGNVERAEKSITIDQLANIAAALKVPVNVLLIEDYYKNS